MSTTRISKLRETEGFTLIELLIVVVIIGILAAIAIPQFTSTKQRAYDATAKSDLRNLITSQEAHFADFNTYGGQITQTQSNANSSTVFFNPSSGLLSEGGSLNAIPGIQIANADASGYEAAAQHPASQNCYGVVVGTPVGASQPGEGEVKQGATSMC